MALCQAIEKNVSGFFIVDYAPNQALILDHANALLLMSGGVMFPPDDGELSLGGFCRLQIHSGKLLGVSL